MSTATAINNAATVGAMYEAFGRGDIPGVINQLADDCQWVGAGEGSLPQGGTYVGKDAINFFQRLGDSIEFTAFNPISINNINDNEVVVFGFMSAISKKTGKSSASNWVMRWKFNEEGKAVYFEDFYDTAAAYLANQ